MFVMVYLMGDRLAKTGLLVLDTDSTECDIIEGAHSVMVIVVGNSIDVDNTNDTNQEGNLLFANKPRTFLRRTEKRLQMNKRNWRSTIH